MTGRELLNKLLELESNGQLNNTEILISTPAKIEYFVISITTDKQDDLKCITLRAN